MFLRSWDPRGQLYQNGEVHAVLQMSFGSIRLTFAFARFRPGPRCVRE